jgi:FkbM family methyltransferase
MEKLKIAQNICKFLPPIISQRVRVFFYPYSLAKKENRELIVRSQTGSRLKVNTNDFHGYPFCVHGYYEWRNVVIAKTLATEGDIIIEIGANVGTETVGFSDAVGESGKVHAFEPLPSNVKYLEELMSLSEKKNIVVQSVAISDENKLSKFIVPRNGMSGQGHLQYRAIIDDETILVETCTLDSISDEIGSAKLIFMDTEGAEVQILKGAREYIKQGQPIIVLEASPKLLLKAGSSIEELYAEIVGLGYKPYEITKLNLKLVDVNNSQSSQNWICIYGNGKKTIKDLRKSIILGGILPCIQGIHPLKR